MLNCRESTRLMSEAQERELGFKEKLSLKFHTLMCGSCRKFGKHMDVIRQAAKRFAGGENEEK